MLQILDNKIAFFNIKPRKFKVLYIILILFLVLIIFLLKLQVYDNYQTKGYVVCDDVCNIVTYYPTNMEYDQMFVNEKLYDKNISNFEIEVDEANMISYRKMTFEADENFLNNEIVDVNFYYNKQRVINKIINLMF